MNVGLEMSFLGTPEVYWGGREVKFPTRKTKALFIYLVVEAGSHPREKLQAIFWPESKTPLAQSALRNTLARMKASVRGVENPLLMVSEHIQFNPSCTYTRDLDLIRQVAADTPSAPITSSTISLWHKAANTVRGPFLEAFSLPDSPAFNDWILIQRTTWEQRLTLIYDRFSRYQLESFLIQPAIETVHRWLSHDALNERAYRRLMRLHFMAGDRSAAMHTYQTCRSILIKELGLQPSIETEEMLAHLRSAPLLLPAGNLPIQVGEPRWTVGDSKAFQALVTAFHQACSGNPQVGVLSGKPGVGKTRLTKEFLNWAASSRQPADILTGRAYELGGGLPYQPVIDALRVRLETENAPEDLLDDTWLVELTRILPELRERYPDLAPASCEDPTTRSKLFEAIARLGAAFSSRKPLVLLLDELQWADDGTLELLYYLARGWQNGDKPVLMLFLIDQEALSPGSALQNWLRGLAGVIPVTRISLEPFQSTGTQIS